MSDRHSAQEHGFEQPDQTVHSPQTNILGPVTGPVLSGQFKGPVTIYSRSQMEQVHECLAQALANYGQQMYQLVTTRPPAPSDRPYKFLYAFELEDADFFFGRDAASEALHKTVLNERLTVLHARSGAGKTSLIKAGLSPRLVREDRLPVYVSNYEDLTLAIKQALVPLSQGPWPELLLSLSLPQFLGLACEHLSRRTRELVIILDQFEDFFTFWPEPEYRMPFIDGLAACYNDRTLPIRFVIALRNDYYSDLAEFKSGIPAIFHNEYRLEPMRQQEARAAIVEPVNRLAGITYEQPLLEQLLSDLAQGGMELPHLQIVCSELFGALPEKESEITLASYESMGRTEGILKSYLGDALQRLPGRYRDTAKQALKELVSSEETKRILSFSDLRTRIEAAPDELEDVLGRLVEERLLYRHKDADEAEYELAHIYLANAIRPWIDQDELSAKKAQDLLQRELASWRAYETWAGRERLDVFRNQAQHLTLDTEAQTFLLQSAMTEGHDIGFWIEFAQDQDAVAEALKPDPLVRRLVRDRRVCRRVSQQLEPEVALPFRKALVSALWHTFETEQGIAKRKTAVALWPFRSRLLRNQRRQVIRVLAPVWGVWGLSAILLITMLSFAGTKVWPFVSRERAVPGQWVTVPEGPFVMGYDRDEAQRAEQMCREGALDPAQCPGAEALLEWSSRREDAWLPAFRIMDNEVTNAQYKQCVDAGECAAPESWKYASQVANKPITKVNWHKATAYCRWLGGRLPTEEEWEKAARGPKAYLFPWGDEWDKDAANLEHSTTGALQSVTRYERTDLSGYKVKNLAGNVIEWTASEYVSFSLVSFENDPLPDGIDDTIDIVLRGGAWGNVRSMGITSFRGAAWATASREELGFRCVCPLGDDCQSPWNIKWMLSGEY